MAEALHLRMPGRVYEQLNGIAERKLNLDIDADVCDALSRAKVKRRGTGYSVFVPLDAEQVERLSLWIRPGFPKFMRDYRNAMRKAAEL